MLFMIEHQAAICFVAALMSVLFSFEIFIFAGRDGVPSRRVGGGSRIAFIQPNSIESVV